MRCLICDYLEFKGWFMELLKHQREDHNHYDYLQDGNK